MSRRAAKWLLWVAFVFTIPVRYSAGDTEFAPTARACFVAAVYLGVTLAEGAVGSIALFARTAGLTALGYLLGWLLVAALGARALGGLRPGVRAAAVALIAGGLLAVSLADIYQTPLSSSRMRSNLVCLFR